jgi:hypothetical protein
MGEPVSRESFDPSVLRVFLDRRIVNWSNGGMSPTMEVGEPYIKNPESFELF